MTCENCCKCCCKPNAPAKVAELFYTGQGWLVQIVYRDQAAAQKQADRMNVMYGERAAPITDKAWKVWRRC